MDKDELPTEKEIPAIEARIEKNLVELASDFQLRLLEGEELIEFYREGKLPFEGLLNHMKELQSISRAIQAGLSLHIQRYYGRSKNARQQKQIAELGFEVNDASPGT